jgi:phosphoglycerate dehydrogenase-like enzyme
MPHMGSATVEARIEMGERVIINIRTFIDGHPLPDRVILQPEDVLAGGEGLPAGASAP